LVSSISLIREHELLTFSMFVDGSYLPLTKFKTPCSFCAPLFGGLGRPVIDLMRGT